jgi:hypothetical protein
LAARTGRVSFDELALGDGWRLAARTGAFRFDDLAFAGGFCLATGTGAFSFGALARAGCGGSWSPGDSTRWPISAAKSARVGAEAKTGARAARTTIRVKCFTALSFRSIGIGNRGEFGKAPLNRT